MVIFGVVLVLLTGFTQEILIDASKESIQQTLKNATLKIDNTLRHAELSAQLEHHTFTANKELIEKLVEVNNFLATLNQLLPHGQLFVVPYEENARPSGYELSKNETQRLGKHNLEMIEDSYVFYHPLNNNRFNLVVICPVKDIFAQYIETQKMALFIGFIGLLLLIYICTTVIRYHLRPLPHLADAAQSIARGNLREAIPNTRREDEIGRLQTSLSKMQRSLASYIEEMQQKQEKLSQHNAELQKAYSEAKEYEDLKVKFLQEMTSQIVSPVETINRSTTIICTNYENLTKEEMTLLETDIVEASDNITQLLEQLLNLPSKKSPFPLHQDPQNTTVT